jgi:hypothetical protein
MHVYEGVVVVDYGSAFVQSGAEAHHESSFAGHANTRHASYCPNLGNNNFASSVV